MKFVKYFFLSAGLINLFLVSMAVFSNMPVHKSNIAIWGYAFAFYFIRQFYVMKRNEKIVVKMQKIISNTSLTDDQRTDKIAEIVKEEFQIKISKE